MFLALLFYRKLIRQIVLVFFLHICYDTAAIGFFHYFEYGNFILMNSIAFFYLIGLTSMVSLSSLFAYIVKEIFGFYDIIDIIIIWFFVYTQKHMLSTIISHALSG